jgi:hypothetical protein
MVQTEVVAEKQQQQRLRDFCYNSFVDEINGETK